MSAVTITTVVRNGEGGWIAVCSCGWSSATANRRNKLALAVASEHGADHQQAGRTPAVPDSKTPRPAVGDIWGRPHGWGENPVVWPPESGGSGRKA